MVLVYFVFLVLCVVVGQEIPENLRPPSLVGVAAKAS
jgi:hypothetical protein